MSSISQLFVEHHGACDRAFAEAEAAGAESRWDDAAVAVRDFAGLLNTHLTAEEETLFPAFEAATGMTQGPTQVMRMEHGHMRALVERMNRALAAKDADEFAGAAETLLILMQQHNMKEEHMLYPMCDRALDGDAALLAKLGAQLSS